jgi:leucyl aminopeptidase
MISFRSTPKFDKSVTIILLTQEQLKKNVVKDLQWASLEKELAGLVKCGQFSAKSGEIFPLSSDNQMIILLGLGKEDELTLTGLRVSVRKALLSSFVKKLSSIEIVPLQKQQDDYSIVAIIEAIVIGTYAWEKYKTPDKENERPVKKYTIIAPDKKVYHDAVVISQNVNFARDLINENADIVNAVFFEKTIKSLCQAEKNISVEILGRKEMANKGLNLHLAVNQGSKNEPRLIIVKYKGTAKNGFDAAFIGKGITFDSGGINLKPSGSVETMRTDMSGAAAVAGTLKNAIALRIKKNILFVFALAENAVGSGAYKPGDVFKSYKGKTVEIGNTDAEGRLVLADALAYVNKNYQPKKIIDIATLTGACIIALGHDYSGLLSNNDSLAKKILEAAAVTDDRVWQLPLYKELKGVMNSPIADLKNISNVKGAGTITGAYFLQQFIDDTPWAHLDIAGTSFVEKGPRMYFGHGGTGAGVRLLTEFIKN